MKKFDKSLLKLYAVTDRSWTGKQTLYEQVEAALKGGITLLQLREKDMPEEEFIKEAIEIKKLTDAYEVPLIINDNVNVCIQSGAAGVHVGQSDMQAMDVRRILGEDKIIGVTAKTVPQAQAALDGGADYIGCGAVFGSATKTDTNRISLEQLDLVCHATGLPVVAIGGINEKNIMELKGHDMDGVAIVSAIFAKEDIEQATKELKKLAESL